MSRRGRQWVYAAMLYAALTIPFGIALHLGAEAIALGSSLDQSTFFARHLYLFLIEAGAGLLLWTCSGNRPCEVLRTQVWSALRVLPAVRQSARSFVLNVAFQWCFFLVTLKLESTTLTGDEFMVGCGVALLGACFSSLVFALLPQKLLAVLVGFYLRQCDTDVPRSPCNDSVPWMISAARFLSGYKTVTGSRPPPSFSHI